MENKKSKDDKTDCRKMERLYIRCLDKDPSIPGETCSKQFDDFIDCNKSNIVEQNYKK